MCAEPPHDGKEWKDKLIMVYPYYGEKRHINEKRLLNKKFTLEDVFERVEKVLYSLDCDLSSGEYTEDMVEDRDIIPSKSYAPIILLLSDGAPNDHWETRKPKNMRLSVRIPSIIIRPKPYQIK